MKKTLTIIALFLTLAGCKKECSLGYEGADCKTEIVNSYFGKYQGSLTVSNSASNYYFEVGTTSGNATEFKIGAFNVTLSNNEGEFYIPGQTVSASGLAYTAYGNGVIDGQRLTMQYTLERNGTYTKFYYTGVKEL